MDLTEARVAGSYGRADEGEHREQLSPWLLEPQSVAIWDSRQDVVTRGGRNPVSRIQRSPRLPYPLSNSPSIDKLSILLYQMRPGRFSPLLAIMSRTLKMIAEKLSPTLSTTVPKHSWTDVQKPCFSLGCNRPDLYFGDQAPSSRMAKAVLCYLTIGCPAYWPHFHAAVKCPSFWILTWPVT